MSQPVDLYDVTFTQPSKFRKTAFRRSGGMWYGDRSTYCYTNIYSTKGKFLGTVECKGYVYQGTEQ